jgi:hypothetical protein
LYTEHCRLDQKNVVSRKAPPQKVQFWIKTPLVGFSVRLLWVAKERLSINVVNTN